MTQERYDIYFNHIETGRIPTLPQHRQELKNMLKDGVLEKIILNDHQPYYRLTDKGLKELKEVQKRGRL